MTRAIAAVLAAALVAALAAAGQVRATTGVEVVVPVKVTLTDKGVLFSHRLKPDTATTIRVKVINQSSARRFFKLGWRKTHTLQRGGTELFYYSFHTRGLTAWRSVPTGAGRTFTGSIRVKLAPPSIAG